MASADFNNVTLRNVAPTNADGSFIRPGYVFTIGPDSKQYWTNTLYLDRIVVSTILINSTLELVAGKFITLGVSSGTISTLTTTFINADSTITTSTMNARNITYSTLTGIVGTTTLLTASTTNTTNIGFSTGSGLYLITNGLTVNTSIVTSTLNGIHLTYSTLVGSTITTSTLFGSTITVSTMNGSTLNVTLLNQNNGYFSTLKGSSLDISTLSVSSLFYSSLYGSSIATSTLFGSSIGFSTTTGSTLTAAIVNVTNANVNNGLYSTITGSSLVTSTLSVSSLYYSTAQGSTLVISTATVSTLGFSTITGSTLTTSLLNVQSTLTGSTINTINATYSTLQGSTMVFNTGFMNSTLIGSTTNMINMTYSTLQGSTMVFNTGFMNSTLIGSTTNMINMTYSTLQGSTMVFNTGFMNSTLIGSTTNMINMTYSTLQGSTLVFNTGVSNSTLIGSTMNMINMTYSTLQGSTLVFNTGVSNSTLIGSTITMTSVNYSTLQGSTITASTINIANLLTISSGNVGIGMTNPTYALQTSTLNSVNLSGNYIENWTTVFSNSDSTAFTVTSANATLSGPSGSPSAMTLAATSTNAVITYIGNLIPGNVYQFSFSAKIITGATLAFSLVNHMSSPIDQQIPGTSSSYSLTTSYNTYTIIFTAPSGKFAISFTGSSGFSASYNSFQLQGFFNQMIGGLGIGTVNPQYSLHVPKGSIQAYNYQQFEWNNTQTSNTIGFNNINTTGLFKIATLGPVSNAANYGMINIRGHLGGWTASSSMYIDLTINTRETFKVYGTVYGSQPAAAPLCDIVYSINSSSQYDIYIYLNKNSSSNVYLCYDLTVSGNSGYNTLYDPAATSVTTSVTSPVSVTGSANLYGTVAGNVGIGTATPGYALHVIGTIYATGDIGALSDRRYKENITPLHGCLDMLNHMSGYTYTRTDYKPGEKQIGLIAQEVNEVLPEAVNYDSINDTYSVNYGCLIAPLMEAVKELREKVERQDVIIHKLMDRLGPE